MKTRTTGQVQQFLESMYQGAPLAPAGPLRWLRQQNGKTVLQQAWGKPGGGVIWLDVPTDLETDKEAAARK